MKLFGFFKQELAIDLGTANTLIIQDGKVVVDEPSIVAINRKTGQTIAVGRKAMQMHEKTHEDIKTVRPLKDGVIADFNAAESMIQGMINMIGNRKRFFSNLRMVVCIPSGITEVEKRAVFDSADHVDSKETYLIYEPMAAALGIGLDVEEPVGNMVIDIGGGTTEIAVIALSGIITDTSIRVGGDELDESIIQFMRRNYNLLIGERTAEEIKTRIGSASKLEQELSIVAKGRDLVEGVPKAVEINSIEIRDAIEEPISQIVDAVKNALEKTPPELAADIRDRGIIMTGGGALIRGLDVRLREETSLPVFLAEDPLTCVVRGTGKVLDDMETYHRVLLPN